MRRLIVCCDGTWNRADWEGGTATNVVRMVRAIKPVAAGVSPDDPGIPQIVYYHQGVGTGNRLDRILGGGLGLGLSQNLRDAYAFLVNNYAPGDEIFLTGFSRGAFTARTLGGLIGTIGLLLKSQMGAFLDAWAFHRLPPHRREARRAEFEAHFPGRRTGVPIKSIAVWDTVGALGVPANRITGKWQPCRSQYRFHNVELGDHVANAFQALAIDERRHPFQPAVWRQSATAPASQVLKQMWFAGPHSDIGGGYADHGASDVALLWIASEFAERGLLDLDEIELARQLDLSKPYGGSALHNSLTQVYSLLFGLLHRRVALGPTEFVHATVERRISAGGYRRRAFLDDHTGRVQPLSAFEARFAAYAPQPMTFRTPFLRETETFCARLVRSLMGE